MAGCSMDQPAMSSAPPLPPLDGVFTASPPEDPRGPFDPVPIDPEEEMELSPPDPFDACAVVQMDARKERYKYVEMTAELISPSLQNCFPAYQPPTCTGAWG